jgi:1-phosphatidylinositol phosphodiesterase
VYHGPRPQRSSLAILITALNAFLLSHPTETLILSLKEESPPWHPHFSSLVYSAFTPYLDRFWFLEERIPALGEVRGKGLLMTRFEKNEGDDGWKGGMGIHPSRWPDSRSEGFEWNCAGTRVRTQDW